MVSLGRDIARVRGNDRGAKNANAAANAIVKARRAAAMSSDASSSTPPIPSPNNTQPIIPTVDDEDDDEESSSDSEGDEDELDDIVPLHVDFTSDVESNEYDMENYFINKREI